MASRDVAALPGSPWGAILEAVKAQIPSLDSDSSSSDCEEEELFIFQRDQTALIPDLSEELAEDPAIDGAPSRSWVAAANTDPYEPAPVPVEFAEEYGSEQKSGTLDSSSQEGRGPRGPFQSHGETSYLARIPEESPTWQEGNLEGISFSTREPQCPPRGLQGEGPTSTHAEDTLTTEGPSTTLSAHQSSTSVGLRALRRERRRLIERDILHKVTQGAQALACGDHTRAKETPRQDPRPETPPGGPQANQPVLSLQQLEEWDLDYILQNLAGLEDRGDSMPGAMWPAADHRQGPDRTVPDQDQLMEQLALLCATQSRPSSSAWKVPADRPHNTEEREASHRRAFTKSGFQTKPSQKPAEGMGLQGPAEPPTVFIDLRQPTSPGCPSVSSSSASSSDSEEDAAALRDHQGPVEGVPQCPQQLRDHTAKSQLLQQLQAFRQRTPAPELSTGEGLGGQKGQAPEDTAGSGTRRKQHVKLWAKGQCVPATLSGAGPRAPGGPLGPATAGEVLVSPLSQP
ncbi:dynein axonemal assembly factor 8 [Orycteropus afer afer]|uniref:Dynein axonemal assembly factor 8 n=1 Tax=Orycteropus afer afer TaxID=1230840 RepID=A0AC54Z5V3_ORYAF|nr:dynein axonemal assembly factor 8 [Orycteropus afer afer]